MNWILDQVFGGRKLEQETARYLRELKRAPMLASRQHADKLLAHLGAASGPKIRLGETLWGAPVVVPFEEMVKACGLVTGGMQSANDFDCDRAHEELSTGRL